MTISENTALETLSAAALTNLGSALYIQENTVLSTIDLSSLTCVDDYTIEGNDLDKAAQYKLLVQLSGC